MEKPLFLHDTLLRTSLNNNVKETQNVVSKMYNNIHLFINYTEYNY